ncbi:MAG: hypothetical protein JF603_13340 [Acidobacteria bacterium]|nr:hypothetical protein [Acidobacteriota bacterium]
MGAVTTWLTTPVPRARIAWLRTILYGFVWFDVLVARPWVRDHGSVPRSLYHPLLVARVLHLPVPTAPMTTAVMLTLLVAAAVAAAGRLPRAAGAMVAALYLEWMLIAFSYGKVDHDPVGRCEASNSPWWSPICCRCGRRPGTGMGS